MSCNLEPCVPEPLRLWQQSGAPFRWVEARRGEWHHQDWLDLLADLSRSGYGSLEPDAVGLVLEETRRQWRNLRRWQEAGAARRWVEECQGRWNHDDWLVLLRDLRESDFWPLDLDQVGAVLERLRAEWCNLQRWKQSDGPRWWVQAHRGHWDHEDWLALLDTLEHSEYWPLNPNEVGQALEETKTRWWNLRRWEESGALQRWVETHPEPWSQTDWFKLLQELGQSAFWPMDVEALEQALQAAAAEERNLRHWELSGEPQRWVEERRGEWDHGDWAALLGALQWSGLWPIDPAAVARVLEEARLRFLEGQELAQSRWWAEIIPGPWDHDGLSFLATPPRQGWQPLGLEPGDEGNRRSVIPLRHAA